MSNIAGWLRNLAAEDYSDGILMTSEGARLHEAAVEIERLRAALERTEQEVAGLYIEKAALRAFNAELVAALEEIIRDDIHEGGHKARVTSIAKDALAKARSAP
jgi:predicted transcriptional regulator